MQKANIPSKRSRLSQKIIGTSLSVGGKPNARLLIAVAVLFGAIGAFMLIRSFAAGPIMSLQGEGSSVQRSGNLGVENDQSASSGSYVQFGEGGASQACGGQTPPKSGGGTWHCTWSDEFNGSSLDRTKWDSMGWTYSMTCFTDNPNYVSVGGGVLTLRAIRQSSSVNCENYSEQQHNGQTIMWRSGGITTENKFGQRYGRFEARIKLPPGPGTFPAFWMDPMFEVNGRPYYGDWPQSGEIDIMESFNNTGANDMSLCNFHYVLPSGQRGQNPTYMNLSGKGEWHTYTLEWKANELKFIIDAGTPQEQVCQTLTNWTPRSPLTNPAPFDRPFFIMLTFGMGNDWGFSPVPSNAQSPSEYVIDYVRVWE